MNFVTIKVSCQQDLIDLLISELFEIDFDSFQELADGFEGSCEEKVFSEEKTNTILSQYPDVTFEVKEQEKINWNEEWEKNYDPIIIEDKCIVRASFHKSQPQFEYEIIITPKMSFGTGHHATTYQVLDYQMRLDHTEKKVLDVGTGTGVLTIMAHKRGASKLVATDIDDWCVENSTENFALNKVKDAQIIQGQIDKVEEKEFDLIIANINKNVLLDQIGRYSERIKQEGELILSGFYEDDIHDLISIGNEYQLEKKIHTVRDRWAMLVFIKHSV
ncbi:MAG: 50S ribosomal protein L11 methyltransferase [Bacteroidota bacterium]